MNSENRDPLLDKLGTLPVLTMNSERRTQSLRAAEEALSGKVRPGIPWPKFAMGAVLALAGAMYTVGCVHKLGNIYVSNQVASLDR